MMRESSHLIPFDASSVVPMCQCDSKDTCRNDRIIAVCFIEVTTTKQQQSIWMLCFQIEELLHHRSEFLTPFIGHLSSFCYLTDKNTKFF